MGPGFKYYDCGVHVFFLCVCVCVLCVHCVGVGLLISDNCQG